MSDEPANKRYRSSRYLTLSCERCFTIKKKCDREVPCGRCVKAHKECRYTYPGTQALQNSSSDSLHTPSYLLQKLDMSVRLAVQNFDQGEDPSAVLQRLKKSYSGIGSNHQAHGYQATPLKNLPARSEAVQFARSYFENQYVWTPFLDIATWFQAFDTAYEPETTLTTHKAFQVYMVLAIGALVRPAISNSGSDPHARADCYRTAMALALDAKGTSTQQHESIERVILQVSYGVVSPHSNLSDMWTMVNTAICQTISLGYHTKHHPGVGRHAAELHKRTFWSLYNLDRLLCMTLGLPATVQDEYVEAEMPEATEYSADHLASSWLPAVDHVTSIIRWSYAMGYISRRVNTHGTDLMGAVKPPQLTDLLIIANEWFDSLGSSSPLLQQFELYYHNLIALSLRPSPSHPATPSEILGWLLHSVHKKISICHDLLVNGKVSWNWIFLYGTMRAAVVLLYIHFNSTIDTNIALYLNLIYETFVAFPADWRVAHNAGRCIEKIIEEFAAGDWSKAGQEILEFLRETHGSGSVYNSGPDLLGNYEMVTSLLADWFELVNGLGI